MTSGPIIKVTKIKLPPSAKKTSGKQGDRSEHFANLWRIRGIAALKPVREYEFHTSRGWRFDFAWPAYKLAVEIEGIMFHGSGKSRHTTVAGYSEDCIKYNEAQLLGWRVLRFTQFDLKKKPCDVIQTVKRALQGR